MSGNLQNKNSEALKTLHGIERILMNAMTSRERVRRVLNHQIPDSVPRGLYEVMIDNYNDSTIELFDKMTGKHPRDCFRHDIRGFNGPARQRSWTAPDGESWSDKIRRVESVDDLCRSGFHEVWVPGLWSGEDLEPPLTRIHSQGYASLFTCGASLAQTAWRLRSQHQFLLDLADRPSWLDLLLDWITEAFVADARIVAKAGPDIYCMGDDIATQRGLLFSPQTWRDFFFPRYKRIVEAVKGVNPEVAVFFHCCGDVTAIITDLISAGVEVLNPLQPEALDPVAIKRQYGQKLVLWGGLGVQSTMSQESPQAVFDAVCRLMATVGVDGGYILSPAHMINPDIPWENIAAFFAAAEQFGNYG